jgi:hypothetical protein
MDDDQETHQRFVVSDTHLYDLITEFQTGATITRRKRWRKSTHR